MISRTQVQLLVISDEIFIDIFVNQNQNNKLNKKHLMDLISRKTKLNHYLKNHPNACLPHFLPHINNASSNNEADESFQNKQINMNDIKVKKIFQLLNKMFFFSRKFTKVS